MRSSGLIRSSGATLQEILRERLAEATDRRALGFYRDAGWNWMTRSDLAKAVSAAAAVLEAEGLGVGSTCVIVLPSDEPAAMAILGAVKLGATPVLVAPPVVVGSKDTERTVEGVVRRTQATVVVATPEVGRLLTGSRDGLAVVSGERFENVARSRGPGREEWHVPIPEDRSFFQLTSGTTGEPKICVWTHRALIAAFVDMAEAMELSEADVCCNWTPLYHDMGLVNNFLLSLASGVPLVMMRPTDFVRRPERWLIALSETRSTQTWSPNFGYALAAARIEDEGVEGVRLDTVRGFWNAAERVHLETLRGFAARFADLGVRREAMKTSYGCAENIGSATFSDLDGPPVHESVDPDDFHERRLARRVPGDDGMAIVGVGRPAPGIDVRILSEDGRPLEDGRIGRLALRTPSRMEGYLDDMEATAEAIQGDWLVMSDLAYTRNGEVFWAGRIQERIVINARKFDPSDFERVLFDIEGLRAGCFVAFGVDDPESGTQRLVIVSEVRDPSRIDDAELVAEVRRRIFLEHGIQPHDVVLVPKGSLPKTSSGKRRHRHFKGDYLEGRFGGVVATGADPARGKSV